MQDSTTNDVLMHHLTAFGNNDLAEIMLDYTEESEVLTSTGAIKGLSAITAFFSDLFSIIPTGSDFEMKQLTVTANVAHIIWASESAVAVIPFGTDTFVMENEKIRFHSVAADIQYK
ncbi:MAG: nuclear transport factor 2 family protein [Flectobacillus sp.]|nr:nuclear transport factor 2 family protein [Flectobacillus sp.]